MLIRAGKTTFAIKELYFGTQELVSRFPTILDQQVIPL